MRLLSLNVELSLPDRFMSLSFTWTASSEVRSKSAEFGPLDHWGESARTPVVRAAPQREKMLDIGSFRPTVEMCVPECGKKKCGFWCPWFGFSNDYPKKCDCLTFHFSALRLLELYLWWQDAAKKQILFLFFHH